MNPLSTLIDKGGQSLTNLLAAPLDPNPVISEFITDYGFAVLSAVGALVVLTLIVLRFRKRSKG